MAFDNPDKAPPANTGLLIAAGILLVIPMAALVPVGLYSKIDPKLGAFPFFVWYQMLWVFLCAGCTSLAYVIVKKARPHVALPAEPEGRHSADHGVAVAEKTASPDPADATDLGKDGDRS
ncbi:DUF3311 domain-containing protein [Rudaeicoccus suwonensis]|uniref:Uncharacterized protein DUF3311 n=1 Tax=Rudaeicoccus suwonensis TaxID=657409 RepID=A0A561E1J7_9MICO|nr:DUF3311 domain-containing protein [Rudaeicoccus suwonensis]TWE09461.1 uncharacterized protein DUF3311 [Rudaeicoccus suwonensis]